MGSQPAGSLTDEDCQLNELVTLSYVPCLRSPRSRLLVRYVFRLVSPPSLASSACTSAHSLTEARLRLYPRLFAMEQQSKAPQDIRNVVNFLRTDFDIASAEGIQNLADVVCWKELQGIVQKHLRLAIFRDAKGRSSNYSGEVTMAHVMKRILGPKTKDSPASSEWLCKALAYDLEFE